MRGEKTLQTSDVSNLLLNFYLPLRNSLLARFLNFQVLFTLKISIMGLKTMVAAAAAGAAAGVLLAPESGSALRQKLSDKLNDVKERWYKVKSSASELEELKEVFRNEIAGLTDDTRKRVLEILEAAKATGSRMKQQIAS